MKRVAIWSAGILPGLWAAGITPAPKTSRILLAPLLLLATIASALIPGDLHVQDSLIPALYHREPFLQGQAHVPNTLTDAKTNLEALIQSDPAKAEGHRALAEVHEKLLDFPSAEAHMQAYVEKSKQSNGSFLALRDFYHRHLLFEKEFDAMQKQATTLPVNAWDVEANTGRYAVYKQIIEHIRRYQLPIDIDSIYQLIIDAYSTYQKPYFEYIQHLKSRDAKAAHQILERFREQFPSERAAYLLLKASLLSETEAFDLLNESFEPLWSQEIYHAFDGYLNSTGKKGEYLEKLKERLTANPLDTDAVLRLFHAYHHAGNLLEAQNTLNDFRLQKEQLVRQKKAGWTAQELYWMASLQQKVLNHNEAARYYYALYSKLHHTSDPNLKPDAALHGLFTVLIAAEDRPIQLSAGNLDYYKDIAAMDQNPGILNGILSLILNGTNPRQQFEYQEEKANGYFNRAEAMRLVRYTRKHHPDSPHLPEMYAISLRIFERYGMDKLLVQAGEEFFQAFPNSPELLKIGITVADAYARMKDSDNEWKTYRYLLPIAAQRNPSQSLIPPRAETEYDDYNADQAGPQIDYEFLLNRYIASLTTAGKHLEVVGLYKQEIAQHPKEETLYEKFAEYLSQNRLFDQEKQIYEEAISRFQERSWYAKLARWYLRFKRDDEYKELSKQIMDIFRGSEIEEYLRESGETTQQLYVALNVYAHEKFPLNTNFVRNLLGYYSGQKMWPEWEKLSKEYYFLDDSIRQAYQEHVSKNNFSLSPGLQHAAGIRFAADRAAWESHFEQATVHFEQLSKLYPADAEINMRLADLKRSLGVQDVQNYYASASIREHLAKITPSDPSLWTTAGETMADIELYDQASAYWERILDIDPYQPAPYIELATIYWDYYLFDEALKTISKIRDLQKDQTLFAYEAGAIYESKRDYNSAIAEYGKSLTNQSDMAWNRLGELYQRKRYQERIRKHLDIYLQKHPQEDQVWSGVIRFYRAQKEKELAGSTIARAVDTLEAEAFQRIAEKLNETTRDLGLKGLQEQVLSRRIKESSGDLERWNRTLDLARFYESGQRTEQAEATYRRLYAEQPNSAGIIQEIVSYYWRRKEYENAFTIYSEALKAANPVWKKKFHAEVAKKYRERRNFDAALVHARELLQIEPLHAEHFQLVAELLAEKKDYKALSDHYREGLKRVQEAPIQPEEKKQRVAALRRGIIQANIILQDYTAAIDQYIEIINRDAESIEGLREAAAFAAKHGLTQRLLDYYSKTAAASPKDHRWAMVLGRLFLHTGDFSAAVRQFETAIAIRPERIDFYQEAAETYQRMRRYEDAIKKYERAYELSFKNKNRLLPIAELSARLGQKARALELYAETLNELNASHREFALARKALEWGELDAAIRHSKAGLDLYFKNPGAVHFHMQGLQTYLEALIRSGKRMESMRVLRDTSDRIEGALAKATFDHEELRSAQYMVRNVFHAQYPELMRQYFLKEDWEAIHKTILTDIQRRGSISMVNAITNEYLPLARAAKMAPLEEQLLQTLAKHYRKSSPSQMGEDWSRYLRWHQQLVSFYEVRHAYSRAARWMAVEHETYRFGFNYRHELIRTAEFFRLADDPAGELTTLRKYYRFGISHDLQPEPVHRYLDLLYQNQRTEELKQAAAAANFISANYFLQKKDHGLSIIAIQSLHQRYKNDSSWLSLQLAMVGREIRTGSDFFDANFNRVLDLRPVGDLLATPVDISRTLEGDPWFYYTRAYGEYLQWTNRADQAPYYLTADLEGMPAAAARQDQLGSFYFGERQFDRALNHFNLALQLDPDYFPAIDHRARALMELGRTQEAIDLWQSTVASETHRNNASLWRLLLQTAVDYRFLDSVRGDIGAFIESRIRETGAGVGSDLLQLYLRNSTDAGQQAVDWIAIAPAPLQFGQILLGYNPDPDVKRRIHHAVNDYLEKRLLTAAGQEQSMLRDDLWRWNRLFATEWIGAGAYHDAAAVLSRTMEQLKSNTDPETEFSIALLHSKALALAGKTEDAASLLQPYLQSEDRQPNEDRYRQAIEAWKNTPLEIRLREEMYSSLIASGRNEESLYIGLAEVALQKQQPDYAKNLLQKMIYFQNEYLPGFHSAAQLLEKFKYWNEAIEFRKELARRIPWDQTNYIQLAGDYKQAGNAIQAAKLARSILVSPSVKASDRSVAATLHKVTAATSPELIAISRLVTGAAKSDKTASEPYAHQLRMVVLNQTTSPSSEILKSEIYLSPEDQSLLLKLFHALIGEGKCLQALETLDPQLERNGSYNPAYGSISEKEYDYHDYSNFPVERLNLSEDETRKVALEMAACAREEREIAGELFFRKMARAHTFTHAEQIALDAEINNLETELEERAKAEAKRHRVSTNIGRNL